MQFGDFAPQSFQLVSHLVMTARMEFFLIVAVMIMFGTIPVITIMFVTIMVIALVLLGMPPTFCIMTVIMMAVIFSFPADDFTDNLAGCSG